MEKAKAKEGSSYPQLRPLWVAVFVDILGFTIILPFLPLLASEFTSDPIVLGLLIASNAIFGFFFSTILGKLSDKYGRKPLLLISQAGTVAAFLLLAFSRTLEILFLARIIDGIFGGQFPISKAIISDVVPPKDRGKQMTNIGVAFTLAAVVGPGIGGMLADIFGIIGPGLLASSVAIFTLAYTWWRYNETLPTKIENPPGWIHAIKEMESTAPDISIIKNTRARYLLLMYAFMVLAAMIFQTTYSLFGSNRLGLTGGQVGILFSAMGAFQVFFRFIVFNRVRERLGDTKTAMIGIGNYIIAYALLYFVPGFWGMMPVLFYISSCGALARGITVSFASRTVDFRNQGKMMGVTTSIDNLSQIIGPIVGNLLLVEASGLFYVLTLSVLSLLAWVMSFRLPGYEFDEAPRHPSASASKVQVPMHGGHMPGFKSSKP